jgi:hypothetical protein
MKQAQSDTARFHLARVGRENGWDARVRLRGVNKGGCAPLRDAKGLASWSVPGLFLALFGGIWFALVLPFRLVFKLIAWLGRMTALLVGLSLVVLGMALWAGPFFWIGIPLLAVGLLVTLRCLD